MALGSLPKTLTLASFFTLSLTTSSSSIVSLSRSPVSYLNRIRPLTAVVAKLRQLSPVDSFRTFATRTTSSSLNDPNPNWSNRPPKETILLDGCDFNHWLVVMEPPEPNTTRDEIIDSYIKTLAQVIGSEDEARVKIYSVSTRHYFAFGALVPEEDSYKIKELPRVRWVLPDSYLDVKNKDYGGEPFINGQAVPYDEKYHAEWVQNNARSNVRNRRNDRPRNFDRSKTFDRRRENMQNRQPMTNAGPNPVGAAPNQGGYGDFPPNQGGYGNVPPSQGGYANVPPNQGGYTNVPPNPGGYGNMPPSQGGFPAHSVGWAQSNQNMGGFPPNQNMRDAARPNQTMAGMQPNAGWSINQQTFTPNREILRSPGGINTT